MRFIHTDLGQRTRGDVVQATLRGSQANVLLLDSSNLSAFRNGRRFRGVGGLATTSPVHLTIPRTGRWHGVAYLPAGSRGRVRVGFRVMPGALPPIQQRPASELTPIRVAADRYVDALGDMDTPDRAFDVFISHAGEDKEAVVRPLAHALRDRGLQVWYDEFELRIGDNLRRKIDRGLVACRFGVVVLSTAFFSKGWPNYELDGLVTREATDGSQLILPIWHGVTLTDVMGYSPSLASKLARSTDRATIDEIADEIAGVAHPVSDADLAASTSPR